MPLKWMNSPYSPKPGKSILKGKKTKIPKATFKGVHNNNGGYHGKATARSVGIHHSTGPLKANPVQLPKPQTMSKHIAAGGTKKSFIQRTKAIADPKTAIGSIHRAHQIAGRNDPANHAGMAKSMNSERKAAQLTRLTKKRKKF